MLYIKDLVDEKIVSRNSNIMENIAKRFVPEGVVSNGHKFYDGCLHLENEGILTDELKTILSQCYTTVKIVNLEKELSRDKVTEKIEKGLTYNCSKRFLKTHTKLISDFDGSSHHMYRVCDSSGLEYDLSVYTLTNDKKYYLYMGPTSDDLSKLQVLRGF